MNELVLNYFENLKKWQSEMRLLQEVILDCGLNEDFKWKHPCYTYNNKNIVLIHGFKAYCAVLFYNGALLKDSHNILIQQTENVQFGRQIRFVDISEIKKLKPIIKSYIFEAIEVEKLGLKVNTKNTSDFEIPEELILKFKENPEFENAFKNLTEGRQRGYLLHFAQPKQSKTRISRIENYSDRIFKRKGLNDCTCGLSKRPPNCDGSHKQLTTNNKQTNNQTNN